MRRSRILGLVTLALMLGAALRLFFIFRYPQVSGDGLIYGDIAKNWLLHGVYGRTVVSTGEIAPTLIRLPGYPLFLAVCFRLFGMEHYNAVLFLQLAIDLVSCVLVALLVRAVCSDRAALAALFLTALCPFTANWVATPLTETVSIFCVALANYALLRLWVRPRWSAAALLCFAWSYAALLRPDGALLAVSGFATLLLLGGKSMPGHPRLGRARAMRYGAAAGLLAVLPFLPWTVRNWRTFRVWEPLAPRYATDPGEFTAPGFQSWTRTWLVDFASTYEIYWNANSDEMDFSKLPRRAFDSPGQYRETQALFANYNEEQTLTPELDARFAELAKARRRAHPLRTELAMPLARVANMWLRPRTEALNVELRWWQGEHHSDETAFALAYGGLNLAYIVLAIAGAVSRRRSWGVLLAAMAGYLALRSLLLADIEAPETRYTIEGFPILSALAASALVRCRTEGAASQTTS